jgi:hypothetical protein
MTALAPPPIASAAEFITVAVELSRAFDLEPSTVTPPMLELVLSPIARAAELATAVTSFSVPLTSEFLTRIPPMLVSELAPMVKLVEFTALVLSNSEPLTLESAKAARGAKVKSSAMSTAVIVLAFPDLLISAIFGSPCDFGCGVKHVYHHSASATL